MNNQFALDRQQAKLFGVCAGVARLTAWDPVLIRIGAIIALLATGPLTILAYIIVALIADAR